MLKSYPYRQLPFRSFASSRALRRAAVLGLFAAIPLALGCFGTFPLTKMTYDFNKKSSRNEFVQTIVFWAILPWYAVCTITDSLVLNVIEFWSEAPIHIEGSASGPPIKAAQRVSPSGDRIELDWTFADGRTLGLVLLRAAPDRYTMTDPTTGRAAGELRRADNGDLMIYDAMGQFRRRLPSVAIL